MGEKRNLTYCRYGATTLFACQYDQRFSYWLYIPSNYQKNKDIIYNLAVIVHGTNRVAQGYRDQFIDFAEETNTIILSPLFPAGITHQWEIDSYKLVIWGGVRYDKILLAMIDEITDAYRVSSEKFLLHGFSGGGQFAHRFFYFHPERLIGVSIGAPGYITLLDTSKPWHVGVQGVEEFLGAPLNWEYMRKVAVQMIIGELDSDSWEVNDQNSIQWMNGIDDTGKTRPERLLALRQNYERNGIHVDYHVVQGAGHEGYKMLLPVKQFFSKCLH